MASNLKLVFIFLSIIFLVKSHIGDAQTTASTSTNGGFNDSDTFLYVEPCIYLFSSSIKAVIYTKNKSASTYGSIDYTLPGTFTADEASSCENNNSTSYN